RFSNSRLYLAVHCAPCERVFTKADSGGTITSLTSIKLRSPMTALEVNANNTGSCCNIVVRNSVSMARQQFCGTRNCGVLGATAQPRQLAFDELQSCVPSLIPIQVERKCLPSLAGH